MSQKEQIQLFEEKKVRSVWDDEKEEWFFSVVDVVEVAYLTDGITVLWFHTVSSGHRFLSSSPTHIP